MDEKIQKKKSLLYYLNPKNVNSEVKEYGYPLSVKKIVGIYLIYILASFALGFAFKLDVFPYILIIALFGLCTLPYIIINGYKQTYEQVRFNDANKYISQMLYSFKTSKKVFYALKETRELFQGTNSPMEMQLNKAINTFLTEGRKKALSYITEIYDCERIEKIHSFMLEVEEKGGNCEKSIELLLNDRKEWSLRTNEFQKEKHKKKINIILGIIVSLLLCLFLEYVLKYMFIDGEGISKCIPVMTCTTILICLDMLIFAFTQKK